MLTFELLYHVCCIGLYRVYMQVLVCFFLKKFSHQHQNAILKRKSACLVLMHTWVLNKMMSAITFVSVEYFTDGNGPCLQNILWTQTETVFVKFLKIRMRIYTCNRVSVFFDTSRQKLEPVNGTLIHGL